MFCEQCGTKIEIGKRFCSRCEEQNIKIIEIPKNDISSINGEILPSKRVLSKSDEQKKIVFVIISFFFSFLLSSLYSNIFLIIISRSSGKFYFILPIISIISWVAGIITFMLICKLLKIEQR